MVKTWEKRATKGKKLALYMQIYVANLSMMNQKQKLQAQSAKTRKLS